MAEADPIEQETPTPEGQETTDVETPEGAPTEPTPEEPPAEPPTEEEGEGNDPDNTPDEEDGQPTDEETDVEGEYQSYDDPSLKQVVNIFKEADLPVDKANEIFSEAVETGDLAKIDRAKLVETVGEDKADIVIALAENYYNKTNAKFQEIETQIHDLVGGKEVFGEIVTWAQTKAAADKQFEKDLGDYRAMIDTQNPKAIQAAVKELHDLYKADPNTTIKADLVVGDGAGVGADNSPLTKADFQKLINEAVRNDTYNQVSASLHARRAAGRKQGI